MPSKYKLVIIVSAVIIALDQLTKWLILTYVPLYSTVPVIPGFFDIVHIRNTGAAFGMFANSDSPLREPFFYVVALIAVVVLISILRKLPNYVTLMSWVIALVFGGLVGNLVDRIRFGNVVDFLSFHWRDAVANWNVLGWHIGFKWEWPSFNVADSAITIAMVLIVIHMIFFEGRNNA